MESGELKYKLYRNRTTKFKETLHFKRLNLCQDDFLASEKGYTLTEQFTYMGLNIVFSIFISSQNLSDLLSIHNNKGFTVIRNGNRFDILLSFNHEVHKGQTICINAGGTYNVISYSINICGPIAKYYQIGGLKRKSHKNRHSKKCVQEDISSPSCNINRVNKKAPIPNYISWAISYPFQGGRVSPR